MITASGVKRVKINTDVLVVTLSTIGLLGALAVNWKYKERQQIERQLEDSKRSFRVVNLHDGQVLTGVFTITADVSGSAYGYTDVWLVVDGKSIDSTPSRPTASGKQQLQFTLRTNQFWNGAHSVCLSGPDGKMQCHKVTFRNKYLRILTPHQKA